MTWSERWNFREQKKNSNWMEKGTDWLGMVKLQTKKITKLFLSNQNGMDHEKNS